jgi:hypothetical protein
VAGTSVQGIQRPLESTGTTNCADIEFFEFSLRFACNLKFCKCQSIFTALENNQKQFCSFVLARFHGKLHSRSFPELSENVKEKQPVRKQMSDNQAVSVCKLSSSTKLPVALTK